MIIAGQDGQLRGIAGDADRRERDRSASEDHPRRRRQQRVGSRGAAERPSPDGRDAVRVRGLQDPGGSAARRAHREGDVDTADGVPVSIRHSNSRRDGDGTPRDRRLIVARRRRERIGSISDRCRRERRKHLLRAGAGFDRAHLHLLRLARVGAQRPDFLRNAVVIGQLRAAVDAPTARNDAEVEHLQRDGVAVAPDNDDEGRDLRPHNSTLTVARHHVEGELVQTRCRGSRIATEQPQCHRGDRGGRENAVSHGISLNEACDAPSRHGWPSTFTGTVLACVFADVPTPSWPPPLLPQVYAR